MAHQKQNESNNYNRTADNFDVDYVNGVMYITCNGICVKVCTGTTTVDKITQDIKAFIENAVTYNNAKKK